MEIQRPDIKSLIDDIDIGKIVLPDFQRDFVWKHDDVVDLLVSVFADYYIGTMLVIDDFRDEAKFKLRLVSGVPEATNINSIVKILLDGQQRCSSLYYALKAPNVPLYGRKNPYRFYFRISAGRSSDWENTIESVNLGNRGQTTKIDNDSNFIKLTHFSNAADLVKLLQARDQSDLIPDVVAFANNLMKYQIQMVELKREMPLDHVVEVFERINRTGLPLNITDLLVARMFKSEIRLRDLIETAIELYPVFSDENQVDIEFALRLMCIFRGIAIKKKSILELSSDTFEADWSTACEYLNKAYERISNPIGGYGAVDFARLVPFRTMIIPLAALLWRIEKNKKLNHDSSYRKVDQWYWVSVFGNRYNEAVNTTTPADFDKMINWLDDDSRVPDFIDRFNVDVVDFRTSSKSSSTYRGVLSLIVISGARDFQSGKDPFSNKTSLEDDHIFPKSIYRDNEILNRTLISMNAEKSNKQPSQYFGALEVLSGRERVEEILLTHLIDANGYSALLSNDIEKFKKSREEVLRKKIAALVPNARGLNRNAEGDA